MQGNACACLAAMGSMQCLHQDTVLLPLRLLDRQPAATIADPPPPPMPTEAALGAAAVMAVACMAGSQDGAIPPAMEQARMRCA